MTLVCASVRLLLGCIEMISSLMHQHPTSTSQRIRGGVLRRRAVNGLVPLVGASLWAAKRLHKHDSSYGFPRYCDGKTCNANSASAALNKWMKTIIGGDYVVHGLRHSLRDSLRAVECPSDIIDQIGGWTTTGIGHADGKGYSVEILAKWMQKIEC